MFLHCVITPIVYLRILFTHVQLYFNPTFSAKTLFFTKVLGSHLHMQLILTVMERLVLYKCICFCTHKKLGLIGVFFFLLLTLSCYWCLPCRLCCVVPPMGTMILYLLKLSKQLLLFVKVCMYVCMVANLRSYHFVSALFEKLGPSEQLLALA